MICHSKTGVVSKNSIDYVRTIFDCYQNNETVVLLRTTDDTRIQLLDVDKIVEPIEEKGWFSLAYAFRNDDAVAQIAFTSGTEGEPKGVYLSHEALNDVTERLNSIMEVDSSIREYVGIPANFSFGLGRFRAVSAVGGEAYLPKNGFDPLEIQEMLISGEINAISAVPSLWRVLLKNKAVFGDEVTQVKWIEIGSQYMSRSEKEELVALFPNAKIAQHYGLTEASRSSFLRLDQNHGDRLESVGQAYGETEFKISDRGLICIRGPHVSKVLLKNGQEVTNIDDDGWFETSDLGSLKEGYLYYQGRADDQINCGGVKLSPDALEREVREYLNIKEGIAIAPVDDVLTGHAILVAHLKDAAIEVSELVDATFEVLKKFGLNNRRAIKTILVDTFPLTSTNKVQRKKLSKLFEESEQTSIKQTVASASGPELSPIEQEIAEIWSEVLELEAIDPDSNFYDLGGDSLSAMIAMISMEKKGVPKPISKGLLQGKTIREIAASAGESEKHQIHSHSVQKTIAVSSVRGIMVLLVIIAHWHQGLLERIPNVDAEYITSIMGPALSMGTPGFAIVYGIGAGCSLYPLMLTDPIRLKSILRKTVAFLLFGITLLAVVKFTDKVLTLPEVTFTDFTNSFFSVLTYYLLITATIFYWFKLISRSAYPVALTILLAVLAYTFHVYLIDNLGSMKTEGVVEFIKLLMTAKYAYFLMLAGTMLGITVGIILATTQENIKIPQLFLFVGLICLFLGVVVWDYTGVRDPWNYWPIQENYIWRWLVYAGVVMLLLSLLYLILNSYNDASILMRAPIQGLSIIGILAFPMFVLHEMVIPFKSIMVSLGVGSGHALGASVGFFVLISVYLYRKFYKMSFATS